MTDLFISRLDDAREKYPSFDCVTISALAGVSPSTVRKWFRGTAKPSNEAILIITALLDKVEKGTHI